MKSLLTTVDPNIISSQLEERGDVLEAEPERVGLPVCGVGAKDDLPLDV